jgi:hypothetical protein
MTPFNWICPHCAVQQTVVTDRFSLQTSGIGVNNVAEGSLAFERTTIGCANPECRKATIFIRIGKDEGRESWRVSSKPEEVIFDQFIRPQGFAKPQPDYIPPPLREDYHEACLIRDLSPKASATLTRRCLQGMIRDFCGISKSRLIDEIKALGEAVDAGTADRSVSLESVTAIDHVRSLGNIGAHMEKDINTIIEVDPGETQAMIDLVELLFDEWYGARHKRQVKLARVESISLSKRVDGIASQEPIAS